MARPQDGESAWELRRQAPREASAEHQSGVPRHAQASEGEPRAAQREGASTLREKGRMIPQVRPGTWITFVGRDEAEETFLASLLGLTIFDEYRLTREELVRRGRKLF